MYWVEGLDEEKEKKYILNTFFREEKVVFFSVLISLLGRTF